MAVAAAVRGARRPSAPSVGHRADPKRGNPVRNLRGPSSAAAFKFCGVIDACHPSAAALERSPPGYRARWTHVWFMRGTTQSTAAVLPWVQGRCPWSFFPPISSGRNGGARRVGAFPGGAPGNRAARQGCRALQTAAMYGGPTDRFGRVPVSRQTGGHRPPLRIWQRTFPRRRPAPGENRSHPSKKRRTLCPSTLPFSASCRCWRG